jgi:hypothetical protein
MEIEMNYQEGKKDEFRAFKDFFLNYLNSSVSFNEAFVRATHKYRELFKITPYQNCQSFLSDFYRSQYED